MHSLYKPLNEEDVMKARFNLFPEGEYDGVVISSEWTTSRSGNAMADISVKVFDDNTGNTQYIRDFLVFTNKMLWKIKHFCDSAGLEKLYEDGLFNPDCAANNNIRVLVTIKPGDLIPDDKLGNKPKGSCYPDKNTILDYIKKPVKSVEDSNKIIDDDLPF